MNVAPFPQHCWIKLHCKPAVVALQTCNPSTQEATQDWSLVQMSLGYTMKSSFKKKKKNHCLFVPHFVSLPIHPLVDIWVMFTVWLLWAAWLWRFPYKGWFASLGSILWGIYLGVDLLNHVGSLFTFGGAAKLSSTNTAPFYISTSNAGWFSHPEAWPIPAAASECSHTGVLQGVQTQQKQRKTWLYWNSPVLSQIPCLMGVSGD